MWVVVGDAVVVTVPSPHSQIYELIANPAPAVEELASTDIIFEYDNISDNVMKAFFNLL